MFIELVVLGILSWASFFWLQCRYLDVLEVLFAWIASQLAQTRRRRALEERCRLGQNWTVGNGRGRKDRKDRKDRKVKKFEDNASDNDSDDKLQDRNKGDGMEELLSPPIKNRLNIRVEQCCDLIAAGLGLVLEDDVTQRFVAPPSPVGEWNLLTRNLRQRNRYLNWRLRMAWLLGWVARYGLLLPIRTIACWLCLFMISGVSMLLGHLPDWCFKKKLVELVLRQCFRITAACLPMIRRFHNTEYRPTKGICVCNHTSPLDVLVLMCDANYSLTGQVHTGILGVLQRALSRVSHHMWFDRKELADREALAVVLRLHCSMEDRPPVLLFPEGTCINNTAVMQFKKGSFAVSDVVYPVAIRYDRQFGEAYWDSTRYSMLRYMLMVVSSWCICCDVWYMPPLSRGKDESPVEFSNRVKAAIADQAKIDNLPWDGNLKRWSPVRDWQ
ncbi:glycerol-3-phosphate acyltransferase 3 [Drosophila teissieri]|uniref:glycerol-3-phosphate acyltransferase 3 n=1 Tax=Drosophila teissieri TaxID=7243 RepID=UPI001CBA3547|nr:glycerol-3-phosphate acyltransferase 3 [Drosophila teissieri]XP_043657853.1 glycerol-3-phosphate acyltransferase 3 [Drosophila teissieri]